LRSGKKYINVDEPDDAAHDLESHCDSTFDSSAGDSPLDISFSVEDSRESLWKKVFRILTALGGDVDIRIRVVRNHPARLLVVS